ncbi:MAG: hypothetical protein B7Z53_04110, partial [Rhodospirillales bacterium 12-71-4]
MPDQSLAGFERHVAACNNIASPATLLRFRIGEEQVGWVGAETARALAFYPRDVHFEPQGVALAGKLRAPGARSEALALLARGLAARGHLTLRHELFDVRPGTEGPVLARLDRGALPVFGIIAHGVHVNGFVRRPDGLHLWVGWRSRTKAVAPGQIDNIVAGGVPSGLSPAETLVKEAAEEASIPPELAALARPVGRVSYVMAAPEGLRRDVLHCHDLELPEPVLLESVRIATETLAMEQPEAFEAWVQDQANIDATPVHRLIAHVMATQPERWANSAFHYLMGDTRRWYLGSSQDITGTTTRLIKRTSDHWQVEDLAAFVAAVLAYRPPPPAAYDTPKDRRGWMHGIRRLQLDLLRALPRGKAGSEARKKIEEESRVFP